MSLPRYALRRILNDQTPTLDARRAICEDVRAHSR